MLYMRTSNRPQKTSASATVMEPVGTADEVGPSKDEQMALHDTGHPGGHIRHNGLVQLIRALSFGLYVLVTCLMINATQFMILPLSLVSKEHYRLAISWTKCCFGVLITSVCQWWSPTTIRVSGDDSVLGQIRQTPDGFLECHFPERLVLLANHQLYTDWLYLWWIAYTNSMHGHIYIILKESLKLIPILGSGMMFFEFVFLRRSWATDRPRLARHMTRLKTAYSGSRTGSPPLDPMWLMIFPEGTNLCPNGRRASAKWAEKQGIKDLQHQLHPRSAGTLYCLQELRPTVQWVYDCTVAYEGIPRDKYGQDIFTLRASFFQGRPPKSVNMYWRRFAVSSIPLDDPQQFDSWIRQRWIEKDELLEFYMQHGRFPPSAASAAANGGAGSRESSRTYGYVETEVRQRHWWEAGQIYACILPVAVVGKMTAGLWDSISTKLSTRPP